jgi:hypothetical protein
MNPYSPRATPGPDNPPAAASPIPPAAANGHLGSDSGRVLPRHTTRTGSCDATISHRAYCMHLRTVGRRKYYNSKVWPEDI